MQSAEYNYKIYNKEFLTIIYYFKKWRSELEGFIKFIRIITDHKNLEYFIIIKRLNA